MTRAPCHPVLSAEAVSAVSGPRQVSVPHPPRLRGWGSPPPLALISGVQAPSAFPSSLLLQPPLPSC